MFTDVASLSQQTCPHLNSDDTKDEEDEEAQEKNVAKHGKSIKEQHHKNSHAFKEHNFQASAL